MPKYSDVQLQNLLNAVTDALFEDRPNVDQWIEQQEIDDEDALGLIRLIDRLNQVWVPVTPSSRFVKRLRQDLMIHESDNVLVKVRRLPPRVHIAAGLALVAGYVILRHRRSSGESEAAPQETLIAQ